MSEIREKLEIALDRVDEAIDILRDLAKVSEEMAETLEDVLYHLEEAGELLNSLISISDYE